MEPTRCVITITPDVEGRWWLHWEFTGLFSDDSQAAGGQYVHTPMFLGLRIAEILEAHREHESRSLTLELET